MIVLGLHTGHDAAAALYVNGKLVSYCKEERLTRIKQDGRRLLLNAIEEVYTIAGIDRSETNVVSMSRMHLDIKYYKKTYRPVRDFLRYLRGKGRMLSGEMKLLNEYNEEKLIRRDLILRDLGLHTDTDLIFTNHHYAHILGSFQYTLWEKDALYISCDGGGDGATYSAYAYDGEKLECLYGGDKYLINPQPAAASVGIAYQIVTKHLGFRANRHEGKITGLAAYGKPVYGQQISETFSVHPDASIGSRFSSTQELRDFIIDIAGKCSREDLAASIQYATEKVILEWINKLLFLFPAKYIGMSGGVFSNVRLNQKVADLPSIEEIYIFPAMGDEGLPIGNCANAVIKSYGLSFLPRYQLPDVYLGRHYKAEYLLNIAFQKGYFIKTNCDVSKHSAQLLQKEKIGAIYSKRMEMGPRALGARSILANPRNPSINKILNDRLERTEFMPFAPYVLEENAGKVFRINGVNHQACRFMTITTEVLDHFHDLIPGVVHVDGTARPQIIERDTNPLYYDILKHFKAMTSIPCLINTSFNAHEEPIINSPDEALNALRDDRVDFLITEEGMIFKNEEQSI